MFIRVSSKHFLYVPSIVDFDNERSILCQIVSNTTIEDNQHVMTDEIDNMTLDSNELAIISKASKSSINMFNSNDLNNQQPVSCDLSQSNFFSSNYTSLSEAQKLNSKCLNSIVYTEQSERYYCAKRCRGLLPIISPIRITDDCLKLHMVKFQSRRNCRRRQKRALQKGKHINTCKSSSTTDLNK
ncbi:unnamed protein product [Rotaria sp. Silwood1]|nr:unnamed protein product [Rotaria sp. Silwood1]CAF3861717.1 unnamed protein product [Rotaria sp. Silwood1]CAF4740673.1 unnamed protein product [Rotaria sp. Silwood1]CAF4744608.1 unnamed protein product [Rotaria sp. Silwood1]